MQYPTTLEIVPLARPPETAVRVPGSKSITNRALVLAALAAHSGNACRLTGALKSEDTEVMLDCLRRLGFTFDVAWPDLTVHSSRLDRPIPANAADLYVANSGTTMRFLTALVAAGRGRY